MRRVLFGFLVILASLQPSVASAAPVNMTLTGAGSNVLAGVYIGPYTALINGQSFNVICDDFLAETYLNESWTANVCFGGADRHTLFITASKGFYGLQMRVKGVDSQ